MEDPDTSGDDLARWLEEAGRRRAARQAAAPEPPAPPPAKPRRRPRFLRELLLLALAAVAFLPYFFADVQLKIYSLHSLIVFVFPHWQ